MAYLEGKNIILVTGKARVDTEFTSATFKVVIKERGENGPAAKGKAAPTIEKVKNVVREYAKAADIDTTRLRTTLKTDIAHNRQTGEPNGYECEYTMSFTGKNLAEATAVHDALTGIVGAHAPSPIFNVNDAEEVQERAFKIAVDAARKKFESHCKALGLNSDNYEVTAWSPQSDEEHHGKTLSIRTEEGPKPVGLEPGKASLDVKVSVWFTRR